MYIYRVTNPLFIQGTRGGRVFPLTMWLLSHRPADILRADTVPHLTKAGKDWFQLWQFPYVHSICPAAQAVASCRSLTPSVFWVVWFFGLERTVTIERRLLVLDYTTKRGATLCNELGQKGKLNGENNTAVNKKRAWTKDKIINKPGTRLTEQVCNNMPTVVLHKLFLE